MTEKALFIIVRITYRTQPVIIRVYGIIERKNSNQ
jgi:hypothetical protein